MPKLVKMLDDAPHGPKVLPWGRTLELPDDLADKLIAEKKAVECRRVVFLLNSGPYNAGEMAVFPLLEAGILIGAKKARPPETP